MTTLLQALVIIAAVSLLLTLITHLSVRAVSRRQRQTTDYPAISVLKPLKGIDDNLYSNLVSLIRQDYPHFEIVFGVAEPDDPALDIARRLQHEYPLARIKIVCGARDIGLNPKVNNLVMMSRYAAHDCVLISDSNVHAEPGYLRAMAAELMQPNVGLVSSVLVGSGEQSLGARLDNLHMNSFVVRAICGADVLCSHPCVIGKSMLFRLSVLQRLGGFAAVGDVLAEDYVLGQRFARAGFKVALSPYLLRAINVKRSLKDFMARHIRWGQMRRRLVPGLYFAEPLLNPVPFLLAGIAVSLTGTNLWFASSRTLCVLFATGLVLRLSSDAALSRKLRNLPLGLADYGFLICKDLLALAIWAVAAIKRTVNWRGTVLEIGKGSVLRPLPSHSAQPERRLARA